MLPAPAARPRLWFYVWCWACHGLALTVICAAIWTVYWPALDQTTGADQFEYLVNTFGHDTTWDIISHSYSYGRTRVLGAGDTMLFRPVFLAWLAWQKAFYAADLAAWQATGVWLHCVVCYQLFRLLCLAARRGAAPRGMAGRGLTTLLAGFVPALVLTLFFALSPSAAVMVTWTHVNGYLVFLICALGALELLLRRDWNARARGWRSAWPPIAAWGLLLVAAFTYEGGQFLALLAGLFLLARCLYRGKPARGIGLLLGFASIALIYQAANLLDQRLHAGQFSPDLTLADVARQALSWDCAAHAWRLTLYALVQPLFPASVEGLASGRMQICEIEWSRLSMGFWPVVGLAAAAAGAALSLRALRPRRLRRTPLLTAGAALAAAVLVLYLGLIVCGRLNMRPAPDTLRVNSYYSYIPFLFGLLACGWLWAAGQAACPRTWRAVRGALLAALILLAVRGGMEVDRLNTAYAATNTGRTVVDEIQAFVEQHKLEPGFGLAFDVAQTRFKGVPVLTIFFRPYENNYQPSHVVRYRDDKVTFLPLEQYLDACPKASRPLVPDLVQVGNDYQIYYFAGKYQAVLFDDDWWEVVSDAPTLAEAEAKAQKEFARLQTRLQAAQ